MKFKVERWRIILPRFIYLCSHLKRNVGLKIATAKDDEISPYLAAVSAIKASEDGKQCKISDFQMT